uniref:Protein bassoon-like n=1 Tax=Sinocyclocheilus anshuiensis TaxID=1608454 RepID=A0A671SBJ8_9TELE
MEEEEDPAEEELRAIVALGDNSSHKKRNLEPEEITDEEFMRRQIMEMSADEENEDEDEEEEMEEEDDDEDEGYGYKKLKKTQKNISDSGKEKRRLTYHSSSFEEDSKTTSDVYKGSAEEDLMASQGGLRRFKTIELNNTNSYSRDMELNNDNDLSLDREPELEMESLTGSPEEQSRGEYSSTLPPTTSSYTSGISPTSISSMEDDSDSSPSRRQQLEEAKQQRKARHRSHGPLLPTIEDSSEEDELREEEELLREQEKMREEEQQRIRSTVRKTKRDKEELRAQRRRERSKTPPSNLSPIEDASPTEELRQAAEMEELHRSSCSEYSPSADSDAEGYEISSKLYKSGSEYNLPTYMSLYSPTEKPQTTSSTAAITTSSSGKQLKSAEEVYEEMMRKAEMLQKQQKQQTQQQSGSGVILQQYSTTTYQESDIRNRQDIEDEYDYPDQDDLHYENEETVDINEEIRQTSQNISKQLDDQMEMDVSYSEKQLLDTGSAFAKLLEQSNALLTPGTSPTQLSAPVSFAETGTGGRIPDVRVTQHFSKDGSKDRLQNQTGKNGITPTVAATTIAAYGVYARDTVTVSHTSASQTVSTTQPNLYDRQLVLQREQLAQQKQQLEQIQSLQQQLQQQLEEQKRQKTVTPISSLLRKVKRTLPSPPPEETHLPMVTPNLSHMLVPSLPSLKGGSRLAAKASLLKDLTHELKAVEQESTKLRKQQAELEEEEKEIDAKLRYLELGITQRKETLAKERDRRELAYLRCMGDSRDYMSDSELNNLRLTAGATSFDSNGLMTRPSMAPLSQFTCELNTAAQFPPTSSFVSYQYPQSLQTAPTPQASTLQSTVPPPAQPSQPGQASTYQPQTDTLTFHQKPRQTSLADLEHNMPVNYEVISNPTVVVTTTAQDITYSQSGLGPSYGQYSTTMASTYGPYSSSVSNTYGGLEQNVPRNYVMIDDICELTKEGMGTSSDSHRNEGHGLYGSDGLHTRGGSTFGRPEDERDADLYDQHHGRGKSTCNYQAQGAHTHGRVVGSSSMGGGSSYYYDDCSHSIPTWAAQRHSSKNQCPSAVMSSRRSKHRKQGIEQKISKFSPIEEAHDVEADLASYTMSTSTTSGYDSGSHYHKLQDGIYGLRSTYSPQRGYYNDEHLYGYGRSRSAGYGMDKISPCERAYRSRSYERDHIDRSYRSNYGHSVCPALHSQYSEKENSHLMTKLMGVGRAFGYPSNSYGSSHSLPDVQDHIRDLTRTIVYKPDDMYIIDDMHCAVSDSEGNWELNASVTAHFKHPPPTQRKRVNS